MKVIIEVNGNSYEYKDVNFSAVGLGDFLEIHHTNDRYRVKSKKWILDGSSVPTLVLTCQIIND